MGLISKNKIDTNKVELQVSVGADDFKAAVDRAFKKNAAKMTLPGFRKGKAPRSLIEKTYGTGMFFEDAVNELYPKAYSAAVDEAGLDPVDMADIEMQDVSDNGFSFKAIVTVKPEVELAKYKGIEAVKTVAPVADADVDAEIEKLRTRNASTVTVENRAAENGDTATIDFDGYVDGVAFDGGKGDNYPLTIGSGTFIPGFEEQIIGHSVGESFDVNVTFPETYGVDTLNGKSAVFKVMLNELKTQLMPALDDEFAKDVSEFNTLQEYKADVKKKLEEKNEQTAATDFENKLMDAVVSGMTAEIPQAMYDTRVNELVRDFEYRLSSQGMDINLFMKYTGDNMENFRKSFAPQAEQQVKVRLALEKIAQLENLTFTDEDVEAEYTRLAGLYQVAADEVKKFIAVKDIRMDMASAKALDIVRENAIATSEEKVADETPVKKKTTKKAKTGTVEE